MSRRKKFFSGAKLKDTGEPLVEEPITEENQEVASPEASARIDALAAQSTLEPLPDEDEVSLDDSYFGEPGLYDHGEIDDPDSEETLEEEENLDALNGTDSAVYEEEPEEEPPVLGRYERRKRRLYGK